MNLRPSHACVTLVLLLASSFPCGADILIVKADGTGQYPNIQAAVDAAVDGDEVHLVAGTYEGSGNYNIDVQGKAITVRSQNLDANSVTIQLADEIYTRAFLLDSNEGPSSVLQALTIRSGDFIEGPDTSGLVWCINSSPTIRDCNFPWNTGSCVQNSGGEPLIVGCLFKENHAEAPFSNAGVQSAGGTITIEDCAFVGNGSWEHGGGAVYIAWGGRSIIRRCSFKENSCRFVGGAIAIYGSGSIIEDCVFVENVTWWGGAIDGFATIRRCLFTLNSSTESGAAINVSGGEMTIEGCTFVRNGWSYAGIIGLDGGSLRIEKSVIAFNGTEAIEGNVASISCVDIFGNEGGDWIGDIADDLGQNGNISADPLFCDLDGGNYYLYSNSPCAPANSNGCGLIGAYDVGCEPSSVEAKSWGKIKEMYR